MQCVSVLTEYGKLSAFRSWPSNSLNFKRVNKLAVSIEQLAQERRISEAELENQKALIARTFFSERNIFHDLGRF